MAGSINDWYANAAARERGDFQYDWQSDDPPDRNPDSWLDDLGMRWVDNGLPREVTKRRRRTAAPRRAAAAGDVGPAMSKLALAVWTIRAEIPGIGTRKLTMRLRERGWPGLTEAAVQVALQEGFPPQPATPRRAALDFKSESAPPIPASSVDPEHRLSRVGLAARKIRAEIPGIGIRKLTMRLRKRGWPELTAAEVQVALALPPPPPADTSMIGPSRTLDVVEKRRTDVCPACGTMISMLGICRCS